MKNISLHSVMSENISFERISFTDNLAFWILQVIICYFQEMIYFQQLSHFLILGIPLISLWVQVYNYIIKNIYFKIIFIA